MKFPLRGYPANTPLNYNPEDRILAYIAEEVRRQQDTPWHVFKMWRAWQYAIVEEGATRLTTQHILDIGAMVDEANEGGFRGGPIFVGGEKKMDAGQVGRAIENLVEAQDRISPEQFYLEFETIHPFYDGNGRTGKILYNWLRGSLHNPVWPSDFFGGIENP